VLRLLFDLDIQQLRANTPFKQEHRQGSVCMYECRVQPCPGMPFRGMLPGMRCGTSNDRVWHRWCIFAVACIASEAGTATIARAAWAENYKTRRTCTQQECNMLYCLCPQRQFNYRSLWFDCGRSYRGIQLRYLGCAHTHTHTNVHVIPNMTSRFGRPLRRPSQNNAHAKCSDMCTPSCTT
jgi:hypothetical protein